MCGIYGLLSARDVSRAPGDELFCCVETFVQAGRVANLAETLADDSASEQLVARASELQAAAQYWTGRAASIRVLTDLELSMRIEAAASRLSAWVEEAEGLLRKGADELQAHLEVVNRLVVSGKDVAWRLEKDVLENATSVRSLVESESEVVLSRAWELNMVLSSLDRLEVRGRDSAGIAVYVWFPGDSELESFLDGPSDESAWRLQLQSRWDERFTDGCVMRPAGSKNVLLFTFKVASEVGKMGDNVAALRRRIESDQLFQAVICEADVQLQALAHTRWASNGVISLANCHPVDSGLSRPVSEGVENSGRLVAVLNGDIDNYRELVETYVDGQSKALHPAITTDAKIIPVVVAHHLERCGDLEQAFRRAVDEFEGSMAIGLMVADRPGEFLFAQKGSGQGLFFGLAGESVSVASEMYGVVELTSSYVKAEGERVEGGEIFRVRNVGGVEKLDVELAENDEFAVVEDERHRVAEITTRDINRNGFPHFFLKEISESVDSVAKTLRSKFDVDENGAVRSRLGEESIPPGLVDGLRDGTVRRIVVVGQGTAAVAAQGVAHLLDCALASLPQGVAVSAEKATEFSAHRLTDDMSDTLVVAVSQSGTTTDTNRTIDLARQRGAWVVGIVNRRNSDLVYKSHGVLYSSDGRDIEMSVASTKAFYAQNVAGQILALSLASALGSLSASELERAVADLEALPEIMRRTLELGEQVRTLAREHSLLRRHWAVVGSGGAKIAADEIRIKLSELCYKSIALDFLEDKKHIDLSSEPLVIVCAVGMAPEVVSDSVKEVAIFKAHSGIPLVIAEEGQTEFEPYAAGVVYVPRYVGALSYLPATMVGHLFGYYAAGELDANADRLRRLRSCVVTLQDDRGYGDDVAGEILESVSTSEANVLVEIDQALEGGRLDGGLDVQRAVKLSRAIDLCLGRVSVDAFGRWKSSSGIIDTVLESFSEAIGELSRPIDAIKHQAKTVTVGISRGEVSTTEEGTIWRALQDLDVSKDDLFESHRAFLSLFDPLVSEIPGATRYGVEHLDPLGRPTDETTIVVEKKAGTARLIESRNETAQRLCGSKWTAVKIRDVILGHGHADGRKIVIVPLVGESSEGQVVVLHVELEDQGERDVRLKALAGRSEFFDRLKGAVTEFNLEWEPALIDAVDNETLFLSLPESVAEQLSRACV